MQNRRQAERRAKLARAIPRREGGRRSQSINAISKQDYRSKSFIALKEARESLYWLDLLHRNDYIDDNQYQSIYADCEELVKLLVTRCKKLNSEL